MALTAPAGGLQAQQADLVLTNGNIITLRVAGERAQAVAIAGGSIVAVGDDAAVRKLVGPATRVIDLHGQTVVPGFNDVHQHPAPVYTWDQPYAVVKLDTVRSMASLIALLKRKAAIMPKGMLIQGRGYNEVMLGGQPTRQWLDKASVDDPILISHLSGHLCAVNSYLLRLSGIDRHTADPPGGALERDPDGEPDGIIKESAHRLLHTERAVATPKPTEAEELAGYQRYFGELLAHGVTSIGDCWTTPAKVSIYQKLRAEGFPLRINCYIGVDYLDQLLSGAIPRLSTDYLRIEGVKIFHGNSLSGKTCWLHEPYDTMNPATGKKDYYGIPPARSQASLDSLVARIHHAGLQVACHSNGDREIEMVLTAFEHAQRSDPRPGMRHRIEHCSITTRDILERVRRDSVIPVFHSYANELGDQLLVYRPALPAASGSPAAGRTLECVMPTRTAEDMGIVWAMHSDYPVSHYDPMHRLDGAVNRRARSGVIIGEGQRIGVEEAIKAYTVGGAYTTHEEDRKGRIVAGQWADLVVLDKDPTAVASDEIKAVRVTMTLVGGKVVYDGGPISY
ncbi:amidohydrolase [Puia dinghuensis]|uniref:Amidohydrolase n=2 Tax=Puia dinghuensis TaxID=1792502 RepID=A0A8J2UJA7_9BACT|nr:amidohydrolase [Puia dinghuensis]